MKAVIPDVHPSELERRRRLGLDRWDEMWEGVLHMAPAPTNERQRILGKLLAFLLPLLKRTGRGSLRVGINVFRESSTQDDYRIPHLTFVAAGRVAETLGVRLALRPGAMPVLVLEDAADSVRATSI